MNLGKSATKILEMLHETFGEYGTHFSRLIESQLKMTNVENSSMKAVTEQSMRSQTPLGSVTEFARRYYQEI
jgi:hypothetical protein